MFNLLTPPKGQPDIAIAKVHDLLNSRVDIDCLWMIPSFLFES